MKKIFTIICTAFFLVGVGFAVQTEAKKSKVDVSGFVDQQHQAFLNGNTMSGIIATLDQEIKKARSKGDESTAEMQEIVRANVVANKKKREIHKKIHDTFAPIDEKRLKKGRTKDIMIETINAYSTAISYYKKQKKNISDQFNVLYDLASLQSSKGNVIIADVIPQIKTATEKTQYKQQAKKAYEDSLIDMQSTITIFQQNSGSQSIDGYYGIFSRDTKTIGANLFLKKANILKNLIDLQPTKEEKMASAQAMLNAYNEIHQKYEASPCDQICTLAHNSRIADVHKIMASIK